MHGNSSAFPAHVVLPYIPDGSENLLQLVSPLISWSFIALYPYLQHADDVCSIASCHPILEDTNKHIVFIWPPFPDDMQLIDIILDHLAHNRGVKLEGFRDPEIIEDLMSDYMENRWNIQPVRLIEVHGLWLCMICAFLHRINDPDTFKCIKNPAKPFKKMLHHEFIEGLTNPTCSEKILDVPMSHRGAPPPFGSVSRFSVKTVPDTWIASWMTATMPGTTPHCSTIGHMDYPRSNGAT